MLARLISWSIENRILVLVASLLLAGGGLLDTWLDFRRRLGRDRAGGN